MKTTITIEDGVTRAEVTSATPRSSEPAGQTIPADAGAASSPAVGTEVSAGGIDGGVPPAWLLDALAAEGAIHAPSTPEGLELVDFDAGAPER